MKPAASVQQLVISPLYRVFQPGVIPVLVLVVVGIIGVTSAVSWLQSSLSLTAAGEVAPVRAQVNRIEGRITDIEGRVANIETRVTTVEMKLARVEATLSDVQKQMTAKEQRDAERFDTLYRYMVTNRRDARAEELAKPAPLVPGDDSVR